MIEDVRSWLLDQHSDTVDADRLEVVERQILQIVASGTAGDFVELGCFRGAMTLWMSVVLESAGQERTIHVFDSFEGLPTPGEHDSDYLGEGEIASTIDDFRATLDAWHRPHPRIHRGWFRDTLGQGLPDRIAFGYLDGDFYDSITESLRETVPRLAPGGVLLIDDYADTTVNPQAWDGLPGVKKACDDFFGTPTPIEVLFGAGDLAFGRYRR